MKLALVEPLQLPKPVMVKVLMPSEVKLMGYEVTSVPSTVAV